VYAYGSPACVDAKLSDFVKPYVITCVLHDDVVPRLTPTSIRGLMKHLLYIRETWVKAHLANDLMAIKERAKTAWAPKVRNGFSLLSAKTSSFKVYGKKLKMKRKLLKRKMMKGCSIKKPSGESCDGLDIRNNAQEDETAANSSSCGEHNCESIGDEDDASDEGLYYEGDCFYEADDSLIEQSDEENSNDDIERCSDPSQGNNNKVEKDEWESSEGEHSKKKSPDVASIDSSSAVLLDEIPLPRMFIPGKIAHIYTHRGGYKATFVPRAFRELRRISLAGNMINDHTSKWYYEALLECRSIRNAHGELPEWTGFREETTCSCCASLFTWASTSDSEAQEARDKHNCRSCGNLVCEPCSRNRVPIPSIGITVPSRICDQCYNDGLTKVGEKDYLTRSFIEGEYENEDKYTAVNESLYQRRADKNCAKHRQGTSTRNINCGSLNMPKLNNSIKKRNIVVDELAARFNSSSFCL